MNKKYLVRLSAKERRVLRDLVRQLNGSSQKVRRAQMLLKADVDGPVWTDEQIAEHPPQLTLLEMQRSIEPAVAAIAASHGLDGESAARACALATAVMIERTRAVLTPSIGFRLAVDGFVESAKTMPLPLATPPAERKPWYRLW